MEDLFFRTEGSGFGHRKGRETGMVQKNKVEVAERLLVALGWSTLGDSFSLVEVEEVRP